MIFPLTEHFCSTFF